MHVLAYSLADNDFQGFWKNVRNSNSARPKATKFATSVGGCTGETNIAEMWHRPSHFKQLYNSIPDSGAKEEFLADRTNGRAYATVLRLYVRLSVCPSVCLSVVCL